MEVNKNNDNALLFIKSSFGLSQSVNGQSVFEDLRGELAKTDQSRQEGY